MASHYDTLGVAPDASGEEIQRAYRRLARLHHPDVAPGADPARMAAINVAWMVLSDPGQRQAYDAARDRQEPPAARPAPPGPSGNGWEPLRFDDEELGPEDWSDEPYADVPRRPSDMLVMTPVLLIVAAVGVFFLSIMSGSSGLRTFSILLVPISGVGFIMAPLFVMLRSKDRSRE
ncbi:MAG TPA: J domain-containing protein [Acidimicrobiales bacterium]|nr:J domain-containing protein [Acidimicrobiales bacterium]